MTTCGPEAAGSTTRDLIASASGTAGSRSKRIQGRSWHVCISAVATGFSWLTHPLTLGALKNPQRKECVCKKSCKKTRESRKSAKITSNRPTRKNRQETHGRHSERIRKAYFPQELHKKQQDIPQELRREHRRENGSAMEREIRKYIFLSVD